MNFKTFEKYSVWLSQFSAAVSLTGIVYLTSKFIFYSGNEAGTLLLIAMIATVFTFIFGVLSLPRWQGFVELAIFSFAAYCILFTPNLCNSVNGLKINPF